MTQPPAIHITFRLRRGLASEWTTTNPVLAQGEPGLEEDTGSFKIGDGVKTWSQLPYFTPETGVTITSGSTAPTDSTLGQFYLQMGA